MGRMTDAAPPLRYLSDADVESVLPGPERAVELAHAALVLRADGDVQVPPKPAVTFGRNGFANAMPVASSAQGLLGCKWISLQPDNPEAGLPTATGLMIVCDARTGLPVCVMAAGELTAARTAAVTGACLKAFISTEEPVAFVGTGAQVFSHLRVLAWMGYRDIRVAGRREQARDAVAAFADRLGVGDRVRVTDSLPQALRDAGAIITGLPIGLDGAEIPEELVRDDAVLLPLDYASSVGTALARTSTVVSDDVEQFAAVAPLKLAADYPSASDWTGNVLGIPKPPGRLLIQNLGNASSDIVIAAEIAANAARLGVGTVLPR